MLSLKNYIITESFKDSLIRDFKKKIDANYWDDWEVSNYIKQILFSQNNATRYGTRTNSDFTWDKVEGPNAEGPIMPGKIEVLNKMLRTLTDNCTPYVFIAMKDFNNFFICNYYDKCLFVQDGYPVFNKIQNRRGDNISKTLNKIKDSGYTGYLYYLVDAYKDARSKSDKRFASHEDIDLNIKKMQWRIQDLKRRKNI